MTSRFLYSKDMTLTPGTNYFLLIENAYYRSSIVLEVEFIKIYYGTDVDPADRRPNNEIPFDESPYCSPFFYDMYNERRDVFGMFRVIRLVEMYGMSVEEIEDITLDAMKKDPRPYLKEQRVLNVIYTKTSNDDIDLFFKNFYVPGELVWIYIGKPGNNSVMLMEATPSNAEYLEQTKPEKKESRHEVSTSSSSACLKKTPPSTTEKKVPAVFDECNPFQTNIKEHEEKYSKPMYSHAKSKHYDDKPRPSIIPPDFVVGEDLPHGVPTSLSDVEPYDPSTMRNSYTDALMRYSLIHLDHSPESTERTRMLTEQYQRTDCFGEEVDCYIGNRLTTYLLTVHPELKEQYPEYADPLASDIFDIDNPVVFKNRNITLAKVLAILNGFKDLNNFFKTFPPLNVMRPLLSEDEAYPNGVYVYRGKEYQGELEKLRVGQTFKLPKITSTSINVDICKKFTTPIITKYEIDGNIVRERLGVFWRIKIPKNFPIAYMNFDEHEVCLPLGTMLRYLGAHVLPVGSNGIYTAENEVKKNYYNRPANAKGALIFEFEVIPVPFKKEVFLNTLINTVKRDYEEGRFDIIAQDMLTPEKAREWDLTLNPFEVTEEDAFGKKRKKRAIRKSKAPRKNKTKKRSSTKTRKHKNK
jgi:hypothetical protein